MSRPERTMGTRAWGAVWTEDGPVAEVRDIRTREEFDAIKDSPDFRWWQLQAMDLDPKLAKTDHTGGKCEPGKPCAKCQNFAPGWWFRWGKRSKERIFKAAMEAARRTDGHWSSAEWGEKRATLADATADAIRLGWPLVCEMDGHGKKLAWTEVSS